MKTAAMGSEGFRGGRLMTRKLHIGALRQGFLATDNVAITYNVINVT